MTNHSKVRNPFTSPDTPTFADLIVRIDGDRGLSCSKKRQVSSALRKVADWIDKQPHEVPASATYLRRALTNFHPQQAGVTRKRVQNATSDVKFAMRHCGVVLNEATYLAALTPEWRALWDLLDGLDYYRSGLSRFMRFVSAQRITPEDVTQATFDAFLLALEAEAITKNPRTQHQTVCRLWNKCAITIQGWPQASIEVPRYRQTYTLKFEEFPESFQVDVEAYLARLAHADLFDLSGPKRALRPKTIACRRMHIRQLASALIHDGMDVEDITALAVIVEHYEAALKWLVNRNGGETRGMIAGIAACLLAIAKYHVKAKPEHLDALARLTSNLTPELTLSEGEITELHVGLKGTMNALFIKAWPSRHIAAWKAVSGRANPPGEKPSDMMLSGVTAKMAAPLAAIARSTGPKPRWFGAFSLFLPRGNRLVPSPSRSTKKVSQGRAADHGRTQPYGATPPSARGPSETSSIGANWSGTSSTMSKIPTPANDLPGSTRQENGSGRTSPTYGSSMMGGLHT